MGALAAPLILVALAACSLTASTSGSSTSGATRTGGSATSGEASLPSISVANTAAGDVLVDSQGKTLYVFASDGKDTSTCAGSCATNWPPAVASLPLTAPDASVMGTIGSFKRSDGAEQLTINGMPLYTFVSDLDPGMANGQGVSAFGAQWWVVAADGTPVTATPTASGVGY